MEKARKKKAESQGGARAQMLIPLLGVLATVKGALLDLVIGSGIEVLQLLLEQDRELLCGARYHHDADRKASRAGYAPGELGLGGRRVTVKRPRARRATARRRSRFRAGRSSRSRTRSTREPWSRWSSA